MSGITNWPTINNSSGSLTNGTLIVQDTFNAIRDALELYWETQAYAIADTWLASSVNPSLGNGTLESVYHQIGDRIRIRVKITMGSTTTFGTGNYSVKLPFNCLVGGGMFNVFAQKLSGGGGGAIYNGRGYVATTNTVLLLTTTEAAGSPAAAFTPTAPFTFASTDIIYVEGEAFLA